MSPITVSFEGQSRNHSEETYWGSGKSSLAEGSWDESLNGNPCEESGLGVPPAVRPLWALGRTASSCPVIPPFSGFFWFPRQGSANTLGEGTK